MATRTATHTVAKMFATWKTHSLSDSVIRTYLYSTFAGIEKGLGSRIFRTPYQRGAEEQGQVLNASTVLIASAGIDIGLVMLLRACLCHILLESQLISSVKIRVLEVESE